MSGRSDSKSETDQGWADISPVRLIDLVKTVSWVLVLIGLILGVPRFSQVVAGLFDYGFIDPDGSYAYASVRHLAFGVITLFLILGIERTKLLDFGLELGDTETGKSYLRSFFIYFSIYAAGAFILVVSTNSFEPFEYPLTTTNIVGYLGFQLLLSGPAEELLFRAFAIVMIAAAIDNRIFDGRVSVANLIAALVFGVAHINFVILPLGIQYDAFQVIYATVLGLIYGDCYEKTNSVIYPMIMHSFTNVIMVGLTIVLSFAF